MNEKKRIEWIDYAKVVGIWLVVLGHILNAGRPIEYELRTIIYSYHMPFFFLVSGLLFSTKGMAFGQFAWTEIKSLIVPYILLNMLCAVLSIPLYTYPEIFPTTELQGLKQDLLTLIDGEFGSAFAQPSWFLITLFCVMIVSYFVTKLKIYWQIVVIGVAILLTYVANRYELCLNWYSIPSGLVFFMVGCMLKGRLKDLKMNRWLLLLLFMAVSTAHVAIALYNGDAAIDHIVGKTLWMYWIGAALGITALYLFANMSRMDVQEHPRVNNFVQIISTGTILILCLHMTLIKYTMDFFLVNHSFYMPLVMREMLLATIITAVCVPVIVLIRRYCPILIGNRR